MTAPRELLDVNAAAFYLGRNVFYVRRLVEQRRITFYRVGHRLLFDVKDLDRHLDESRVEPWS